MFLSKADASRANSLKSTGPRTAGGKAASRNNALKHGMRSRKVVLPGEDPAQYASLLIEIAAEFKPATPHERRLVKLMADARWRLERLKGIEAALFSMKDPDFAALDRIMEWQLFAERSFYKAYDELKSLKEAAAPARPPAQEAIRRPADGSNGASALL